jgi:hypothetical protein
MPKTHKTRFKELGFWNLEPGCWQVVDVSGDKPAQVGCHYSSKAELLANLEAYATEYGCEGAQPKAQGMPWCERCQCWHYATAEHIHRDTTRAEYTGQAHHMAKAANSLITLLMGVDYSKFSKQDSIILTGAIHRLMNQIERALADTYNGKTETYPVTRKDGRVVQVTVPEREDLQDAIRREL